MSTSALSAAVTGANRGLGLELCRQLCSNEKYQKVFALCRKTSEGLTQLAAANKKIAVVEGIQVMDKNVASVLEREFCGGTTTKANDDKIIPIDLLIHNAGAYGPPEPNLSVEEMYQSQNLDNITPDRMLYSLQLNALAPLFVTKALLPNLRAVEASANAKSNKKVIVIGSLMGSIADNGSGSHYGYRAAKAAVNQIAKSLSVDLKDDGIAVGVVHPGYVYTGFGGEGVPKREGQRDVEESVRGVLEAVDQVSMENTGCFLHGNYGEGVKPLNW